MPEQNGRPLTAQLEFFIGKELTLKLTTRNHSDRSQLFSEALHSYFSVGKTTQTKVTGLDGCDYIDTTREHETRHHQSGPIDFLGEVDRIYHNHQPVTVEDRANQSQVSRPATDVAYQQAITDGQRLSPRFACFGQPGAG